MTAVGRERLAELYGDRVVDELEFLLRTLDEIELVIQRGWDAYADDVLLQRAVEGSANRIGDTIRNKVPVKLQNDHLGVDAWSEWVDWRAFLAHHYHRVDPRRIWQDMIRDVPRFRRFIAEDLLGD